MTTLIIADDHPLFRSALKDVIRQVYPEGVLEEASDFAELQNRIVATRMRIWSFWTCICPEPTGSAPCCS